MVKEDESFPDPSAREVSERLAGADRRFFLKSLGTVAVAAPILGLAEIPLLAGEDNLALEGQAACVSLSGLADMSTDVAVTLATPGITTARFYEIFRGQGIPDDILNELGQEYGPYVLDASGGASGQTLSGASAAYTLPISGNRVVEIAPGTVTVVGADGAVMQRYTFDDSSADAAANFLSQLIDSESGLRDNILRFDDGFGRATANATGLDIEPADVASIARALISFYLWHLLCIRLYYRWVWYCRFLPFRLRLLWRILCYLVIWRWRARCPILRLLAAALRAVPA